MNEEEKGAIERNINHIMFVARDLPAGDTRDRYIIGNLFPLFDQMHGLGYSVEFNEQTGRYFLESVGERWKRITHSSTYARGLL